MLFSSAYKLFTISDWYESLWTKTIYLRVCVCFILAHPVYVVYVARLSFKHASKAP